jgi:predicted DNA-binding transcriptional regulator YafY
VLPAGLAQRVTALEEALDFTRPRPARAAGPDTGVLLALGSAVARRHRVGLTYRSWRGSESDRDLDPYGLVFHAGRWYVTGHDHASDEIRTFRLDRIRSVHPGSATFEVPAGFDPVARVTQGLAAVPYAHQVEILLETSLDEARRAIPPSVGTLTAQAGGVLLTCRAEHLAGMARMVASWPWGYTVLRPDALRTELLALAGRIAARATGTGGQSGDEHPDLGA